MTDTRATGRTNRGPGAAAQNRAALIDAARAAFAEEGYNTPLSAVARRAGVGQGSLYRHFPDRVSLAIAVFADNVAELERLGADPTTTLDDLFDAIAAQVLESPAFAEMMHSVRDDERVEDLERRMIALLEVELRRARAHGTVADWINPTDVLMGIAMLGMVVGNSPAGARASVSERARGILRAAFRRVGPAD